MGNHLTFRFDNVVTASGLMRFDFICENPHYTGPQDANGEGLITLPGELVVQIGRYNETLEEGFAVLAGEWEMHFADTFESGLLQFDKRADTMKPEIGLWPDSMHTSTWRTPPLHRDLDFSLWSLMQMTNTSANYMTTRQVTQTGFPSHIKMVVWLQWQGQWLCRFRGRVVIPSCKIDKDWSWDQTVAGKILKDSPFREYVSDERTISIIAIDETKALLDEMNWELTAVANSPSGTFVDWIMPGEANPNIMQFATRANMMSLPIWDSYMGPNQDPSLMTCFPEELANGNSVIRAFGGGPTGDSVAWCGFRLDELLENLYESAFLSQFGDGTNETDWAAEVEVCSFKLQCAGIPTTSFTRLNGLLGTNCFDATLASNSQVIDPSDHVVTSKLVPIGNGNGKTTALTSINGVDSPFTGVRETVWLHRSFIEDIQWTQIPTGGGAGVPTTKKGNSDGGVEYYASPWDIIVRVLAGLGYISRFSADPDGKFRAQHYMRSRKPALVRIPGYLSGSREPSISNYDAIDVAPPKGFGKVIPVRFTTAPMNGIFPNKNPTPNMDWKDNITHYEPAFDQTLISVQIDTGVGFGTTAQITNNDYAPYQPFRTPNGVQEALNPLKVDSPFGLFANCGGLLSGAQPIITTFFGETVITGMTARFTWMPFGSNSEDFHKQIGAIPGTTTLFMHSSELSSYPGLILFAGWSNDGGKTIQNTSLALPAGNRYNEYFRGAGTVSVPYGVQSADGTFATMLESCSYLEALGLFLVQFKLGNISSETFTLPTCTNFENDRGEVGPWAIYPSLRVHNYGRDWLITQTTQDYDSDTTEIIVEEIPPLPPTPTPRFTAHFKADDNTPTIDPPVNKQNSDGGITRITGG